MRTAAQISRAVGLSSRNGPGRFIINEKQKQRGIHSCLRTASKKDSQRYISTPSLPRSAGPLALLQTRCNPWIYPLCNKVYSQRGLMTQPNKQEPVLKYSEENDPLVTPQEYRLRVGKALRTLNDELPQFFDRGLCTTSIYASNIRLIEASHTNASMQGKTLYFLLAGAVRWSFKVWFRDLEFEIQSIRVNDRGQRGLKGMNSGSDFDNTTASSRRLFRVSDLNSITETHQSFANGFSNELAYHRHPQKSCVVVGTNHLDKFGEMIDSADSRKGVSDGERLPLPATTITVRWTMKGTTRPSVVLTSSGPTLPPPSYYSGVFIYKFNDLGQIDEHRIENIMPSPSPEAIQRAISWWGWLLSRTRPAAAAATDSSETGTRKRLGLGCITNK